MLISGKQRIADERHLLIVIIIIIIIITHAPATEASTDDDGNLSNKQSFSLSLVLRRTFYDSQSEREECESFLEIYKNKLRAITFPMCFKFHYPSLLTFAPACQFISHLALAFYLSSRRDCKNVNLN
jgi:hypothetical protein